MAPRDASLAMAQEALNRIDKHEAVCSERWRNIENYMKEAKEARVAQHIENTAAIKAINTSVGNLYSWRFALASTLILILGSGVVSMAVYIVQRN